MHSLSHHYSFSLFDKIEEVKKANKEKQNFLNLLETERKQPFNNSQISNSSKVHSTDPDDKVPSLDSKVQNKSLIKPQSFLSDLNDSGLESLRYSLQKKPQKNDLKDFKEFIQLEFASFKQEIEKNLILGRNEKTGNHELSQEKSFLTVLNGAKAPLRESKTSSKTGSAKDRLFERKELKKKDEMVQSNLTVLSLHTSSINVFPEKIHRRQVSFKPSDYSTNSIMKDSKHSYLKFDTSYLSSFLPQQKEPAKVKKETKSDEKIKTKISDWKRQEMWDPFESNFFAEEKPKKKKNSSNKAVLSQSHVIETKAKDCLIVDSTLSSTAKAEKSFKKSVLLNIGLDGKSISNYFKELKQKAIENIKYRQRCILRTAHRDKSISELIEIRKRAIQGNRYKHKNTLAEPQISCEKPQFDPSPALIQRLISGERQKISKEEMQSLTKRNYEQLPEVKKLRDEQRKRENKQVLIQKAKDYCKGFFSNLYSN